MVGNKQQDAIISFLFFGSGWAVCAVARWINTTSTHCLACDPLPARRGHPSRTLALWLIGRPWPKAAAIHAAAPPCSPTAVPMPIGDAESDGDDGGGVQHGFAASFWAENSIPGGRQLPTKLLAKVQQDSGGRGQNRSRPGGL